ncbi:hypothetical protein [Mycolicibacterium palauense]|uniref:hypothetical protein n=1 Tax=Mycolicibacterium palauense TaxID=2034511 RepID=UPI000BFF069A|nr:hypothetical protein [Mycolicibacterium palauense]
MAAALVSCSNTTDGVATCPGCGTNAEPNFPTPKPSVSPPSTTAAPERPTGPSGPSSAIAAPPGTETLPPNDQGYVFVQTKSGKTRCQLNRETVGCESQFENSPDIDGTPANGVSVTSGGSVHWVLGNLGNIPAVTLDYRTYTAQGWTIDAEAGGTRFTNDATGHGMFVAVQGVESF